MLDDMDLKTTIAAILGLDDRTLGEVVARVPRVALLVRRCLEYVLADLKEEEEENNE
jgi:hypothetical protein